MCDWSLGDFPLEKWRFGIRQLSLGQDEASLAGHGHPMARLGALVSSLLGL